jgi:hypothetical protein
MELFYDVRDGSYWAKISGEYVQPNKSDLILEMRTRGYNHERAVEFENGIFRETEIPFIEAMRGRRISFAGPLAGHRIGIYRDGCGRSCLITEEARAVWDPIPKKIVEPEFFSSFVRELLPGDQWIQFCFWMSLSLSSLRNQDFQPGPACFFAGEANCGKSLLQSIITEVFGGRSANPLKFMTGETPFNRDICAAEHLTIEDPKTATDTKSRRELGQTLKNMLYSGITSVHAKGKDAFNLPVWRRITGSLNKSAEDMSGVPPIEESLADKLFLFLCERVVDSFKPFRKKRLETADLGLGIDPARNETVIDRRELWKQIVIEAPMIRGWLLTQFNSIPLEQQDSRSGIKAWQHPVLLEELSGLAPETRLLNLVDSVLFKPGDPLDCIWRGKSFDLEAVLRKSDFHFAAEKIFSWPGAAGQYLSRLEKSKPTRVSKRKLEGHTVWTILRAPETKTTE